MLDLSLHLLDLLENSAHAGATHVEVEITEDEKADLLQISVKDNGEGMDQRQKELARDPFYSSSPGKRIGLGIPLVLQTAEMAGGNVSLESEKGSGTKIIVNYRLGHIDRQPLGDVASSLVSFIAGNPGVELSFRYSGPKGKFYLDTREMRRELSETCFSQIKFLSSIDEKLRQGLEEAGFRPDRGGFSFEVPRRT